MPFINTTTTTSTCEMTDEEMGTIDAILAKFAGARALSNAFPVNT